MSPTVPHKAAGPPATPAFSTPVEDEAAARAAASPSRVTPGRLAKWLVVAALGLATAVLALVGALTVTRGTPVERFRAPAGGAMPAVADPSFARTVALYTGAPLAPGHAVELLTDGDGTYRRISAELRAARRLVAVQLCFAQPGAVADTMARVLAERARAGVRMLVILDAFGSQNLPTRWFDTLRTVGAEVVKLRRMRWYKLDRVTRRSHVRAVVVDGAVEYTGGFGLADCWRGDGRTPGEWRETNVRFRGAAVAQLQAAFGAAWAEATGQLLGCGVWLYEYRPAMMHAKTLVTHGPRSVVGSMNFDNCSLAPNDDAALVALDAGVGQTLDSLFRADLRYAREVTAPTFARLPWWERPLELGASLLSRVL